jgi:hypothetical protein
VRSRLAWLIGLAGLLALLRRLRPRPAELASAPDPAAELRRKLDATREETPVPEAPPPADDLDARRRQVHDAGRAAVDEMGLPARGD